MSQRASHRRKRVAHELRSRLAEILATRVNDPRVAEINVVEVRPTPDFSIARVFYRTIGDPNEAAKALEAAGPFIRRCLAETLEMRRVPQLEFRFDHSAERAENVERILSEVREQDRARKRDPGEPS